MPHPIMIKPVLNKWQYDATQAKLSLLKLQLDKRGGILKAPLGLIKYYNHLATACFFYEMENDMLPI